MWQRLTVALVLAAGCTIGDPSSTAEGDSSGGKGGKPAGNAGKGGAAGKGGTAGNGPSGAGREGDGAGRGGGSAGSSQGSAGRGGRGGGESSGGDAGSAGDGGGETGTGGSAGTSVGVGGAHAGGTGGASGEHSGGKDSGGESGAGGARDETGESYAGWWSGVTSQGGAISLLYDGAGLVELTYDWVLPLCASTTHVTTPSRPAIEDGHFEYYAGGDPSADFSIDFDSATTAHGTFEFVLKNPGPPMPVPVCRGSETVTFELTKEP